MRRTHREVEEKRFVALASPNPFDGLGDHAWLVFHILHVLHNAILLDDRLDVPRVGEAVKVTEARCVRAFLESRADRDVLLVSRLAVPNHAEVPLADPAQSGRQAVRTMRCVVFIVLVLFIGSVAV